MKTIFCSNFNRETRNSDLERLFSKYGRIRFIDMRSGFAFVHFEHECDARDAIRGRNNTRFGDTMNKLKVDWARGNRDAYYDARASHQIPNNTLFVINFNPRHTTVSDLKRHFEPYGRILDVRIRSSFAFVEYESLDDAIKGLRSTHMSTLYDRVISVEYALARSEPSLR